MICLFGALFCVLSAGAVALQWPKADFQTADGAKIIRDDLQRLCLSDLHATYSFRKLAYYGYVSSEHANQMEAMCEAMPHYMDPSPQSNRFLGVEFAHRVNRDVYQRRQEIEDRFSQLRRRPGFVLSPAP